MMRHGLAIFTLLAFTACGTGTSKEEGATTTGATAGGGGGGGGGGTIGGGGGADSGGPGGAKWEPVAVGFELEGAMYSDGSLGSYVFVSTGGPVEPFPTVTLTLASIAYFGGATDESCEMFAVFVPQGETWNEGDPSWDGMHAPYDGRFETAQMADYGEELGWEGGPESASDVPHVVWDGWLDIVSDDCGDAAVPPSEWLSAPGAEAYETAGEVFDGMHFGVQLAPHTDYQYSAWADWSQIGDYEQAMTSHYICIEYASGFRCEDWTTGFHWQFDEDSRQADSEDGYYLPLDVSSIPAGSPLPPAFINSSAYWYQDFPLMDFGSLKNGVE